MTMITVKELKEWLDNFPEDTKVKVAIQQESRSCEWPESGHIEFESPSLTLPIGGSDRGWEYYKGVLYIGERY